MNLPKVTETLYEHGISHTMIAPHVIRVTWLVGGASQPVVEYDIKHNFTRFIGRFRQMTWKDKETLKNVVDSLKVENIS